MSTHLLAIAEELADRIGIVDRGRMLAVGTLEELRVQLQHRGPLEELFLKLTGDQRLRVRRDDRQPELAGTATMSLAVSNTAGVADSPPVTALQTARALRRLRWRLTRNTIASLLSGSRLRLSMIVFCSVVFWAGLFGLFLGGFEFIGLSDELFHAIFEYLFSMFFLSISIMLFFSTGIITYTGLFHSREGAFLLTTPATTDRIFAYKFGESVVDLELGLLSAGKPADGGLRAHDQSAGRLLCHVSDLPGDVRADRGKSGRDRRDRGRQRLSQAAEGGACRGRHHDRGPVRRPGGASVANAGRHAHERLAGKRSEPAGVLPAPAVAKPVDVSRAARLGAW